MILHMSWLPRVRGYEGIEAKLMDLQRGADRAGVDLRVVVVTDDPIQGIRQPILPLPGVPGALRPLVRCLAMGRSVRLDQAAAIILRYPGAFDFSAPGFLAHYGSRIVTEHHSDVLAEYRKLSMGWIRAPLERFLSPFFLSSVAGAVAVTGELADQCHRGGLRGPTAVIANGVDVARFPSWMGPPCVGVVRAMAISGVFWPWQGLDRVLRGILLRPSVPFELHVAGEVRSHGELQLVRDCLRARPGSVVLHGPLDGPGLDALAAQMHVAISSLALHRKSMTEACPIKSREYAARGIPFVYAYKDPDLPEGLPGTLRLEMGEEAIDPGVVADFARLSAGSAGELRGFAELHLDYGAKAMAMQRFARSCIG